MLTSLVLLNFLLKVNPFSVLKKEITSSKYHFSPIFCSQKRKPKMEEIFLIMHSHKEAADKPITVHETILSFTCVS